jgi:hypothetical protein
LDFNTDCHGVLLSRFYAELQRIRAPSRPGTRRKLSSSKREMVISTSSRWSSGCGHERACC